MRDVTGRELATVSVATRVEQRFWARFWESLRNSFGGVCV